LFFSFFVLLSSKNVYLFLSYFGWGMGGRWENKGCDIVN